MWRICHIILKKKSTRIFSSLMPLPPFLLPPLAYSIPFLQPSFLFQTLYFSLSRSKSSPFISLSNRAFLYLTAELPISLSRQPCVSLSCGRAFLSSSRTLPISLSCGQTPHFCPAPKNLQVAMHRKESDLHHSSPSRAILGSARVDMVG